MVCGGVRAGKCLQGVPAGSGELEMSPEDVEDVEGGS